MLVLIIGGAGRLGINVCETFLQDGFQIRIFDRETPDNRKSVKPLKGRADIQWGDICQPELVRQSLEGVDAVVHMAGILPPISEEKPELTARVHVDGTKNIVNIIKEKGINTPFIFTSSTAVFGPTPDATEPLSPEKNYPNPNCIYGETKLQAENLIKESGIDYVILRLSAIMYPIFKTTDLPRVVSIPLDNRIEFCHSDDMALATLNAVKNFDNIKGNTLIIGGGPGQQMLYRDLIGALLKVLGLPLPPANKFTQEPYYLDWYDTTKSQELLHFQHKTIDDYLVDYNKELKRRYTPLFVPFMHYFVGPLFGKIIVRFL